MQCGHDRFRLGLPNRPAVLGARSPDALLDGVDLGETLDHLPREGRLRRLVDADELAPRMGKAKSQPNFADRPFVALQRLVSGISIDLKDACKPDELLGDLL